MIYCTVQNHPTFHLEERLVNLSRGRECFASLSILLVYAMGALLYKFLTVWLSNCSVQDFCDWSVYESAGSRNNFMFTRTRGGDQVVYLIYICNFDYAEIFVLKVRTFDSMVSSTWLQRRLFDTSELWTFSAKKNSFIPWGLIHPKKTPLGKQLFRTLVLE